MPTWNREDGWESATFRGSRRAAILRARSLTVYERLQTMVNLSHTAAELGRMAERWSRRATPADPSSPTIDNGRE